MTTYTLYYNGKFVTRDDDNVVIPNEPMNKDWIEYQAWLAAGNTPYQAPPESSPAMKRSAPTKAKRQ